MNVKRFGGHQCRRCGAKFDGLTSKKRAQACYDLGVPRQKFRRGQHVYITQGNRKDSKPYVITATTIERRVVRKGRKVVKAFHIRSYHLRDLLGKPLGNWPWIAEFKLRARP